MTIRITSIFFTLYFCTGLIYSEKLEVLEDIINPFMMRVGKNIIYISDQYFVFYYSKDDLKIIKKVGGQGEGPGLFLNKPSIKIYNRNFFFYSPFHFAFYSKSGELISEERIAKNFFDLDYVNGNFVTSSLNFEQGLGKYYLHNFKIFDSDFKEIKTFHSEKISSVSSKKSVKKFLIKPLTKFQSYKGKLYFVNGQKGFHIEILNSQGDLLNVIHKDYGKIKIPRPYKKRKLEEYRNIPVVKKRWQSLTKLFEFTFPYYFPPIQDFRITDDKMYIKTYQLLKQKIKYIVLDLTGKFLGKFFLPDIKERIYDIYENTFYFLKENKDLEEWELHAEKLTGNFK